MTEIELLPQSRFLKRITELEKEAAPPLARVAATAFRAARPAAKAAPRVATAASRGTRASGGILRSLKQLLGLGALGGAGGLGYTANKMIGEQDDEKQKLIDAIRGKLKEKPPSPYSDDHMNNALSSFNQKWRFNPSGGNYLRRDGGGAISNKAYNRRLGALAREYSMSDGNNSPRAYEKTLKQWRQGRTKDLDGLMKQFEEKSKSPWMKPSFYKDVPKRFYNDLFGE